MALPLQNRKQNTCETLAIAYEKTLFLNALKALAWIKTDFKIVLPFVVLENSKAIYQHLHESMSLSFCLIIINNIFLTFHQYFILYQTKMFLKLSAVWFLVLSAHRVHLFNWKFHKLKFWNGNMDI